MKTVAHRGCWSDPSNENSLESLRAAFVDGLDVETDLRLHQGRIVLSHDPVVAGESPPLLDDLLRLADEFPESSLFLNVKEDGLLPALLKNKAWQNKRVVFFDMSVPELVKYSRTLDRRYLATRWSDVEREPVLVERCDWLWVDCFDSQIDFASEQNRRLILEKSPVFVSPQLHGRKADAFLQQIETLERELGREFLVCRDVPL
jgi:glycerophosphoryl diester phosphodiesterase